MIRKFTMVVLLFQSFLVASCGKLCKDKELSITRGVYTGTLKTNGYYFFKSDSESAKTFFLYRNGVVQGDYNSEPLDAVENGTVNFDASRSLNEQTKYVWGAFYANAQEIEIECWRPAHSGCFKTKLRKGTILNDSTFLITKIELLRKNGKVESDFDVNDTFYFHALTHKPDSTNDFVK
jgi:hypothetical protein